MVHKIDPLRWVQGMTKTVPQHLIDSILDKTNIVELIGQYLPLKRSGGNHVAVCPFHGDKDPSFNVNEVRQFYHCFGCGESGNAIAFLMKFHGYTFREALANLADRAGVELVFEDATGDAAFANRRDFLDVLSWAAKFYQEGLARSGRAQAYVQRRRIRPEVATRFGLGYAPTPWDELARALTRLGTEARGKGETLGLIRPNKSGDGWYDLFRDRLMFPVYNQDGRVVGFSGRTLGDDPDAPKYVNSPDSHLYHKGRLLFALHQARDGIRRANRAILVEGNVDAVSMHQAGFDETVAPLGTALTPQQAALLKRLARDVVMLYDGDAAGVKAGFRSLLVFLQVGLHPRLALLPQGDDPDSFLAKHPASDLAPLLDRAPHGIEVAIEHFLAGADNEAAKARAVDEVLAFVRACESGVERELWARRLAERAGVQPDDMLAQLRFQPKVVKLPTELSNDVQRAIELFRVCVQEPALLDQLTDDRLVLLDDTGLRELFVLAIEAWRSAGDVRPDVIEAAGVPEGLRSKLMEAFFHDEATTGEARLEDFRRILAKLQRARWEAEEADIKKEIKRLGSESGDTSAGQLDLLARLKEIRSRIQIVQQYLDRLSRKERVHVEEVH